MKSREFVSLAILATALAPPAAAQSSSKPCEGNPEMTDRSSKGSTIIRSGTGHRALVRREGDGTVRVEQHGKDHAALAIQSGDGSSLYIDQSGHMADADVRQRGKCNSTELAQSGSGSRATVDQTGSSNRAVVRQGSREE